MQSPPAPSIPHAQPTRTGWAGAVLVSLTLTCMVITIAGAWWLGARNPHRSIVRYLPADNSAIFRIVHGKAGQRTSTLSTNTIQRNAAWMLRQSNAVVYTSIADAMALGSDTRANLQALLRAAALYSSSVEQTEIKGMRVTTTTADSYLLQPDALLLVMERTANGSFAFVPPLPVLRSDLAIDQTLVTTGVIASLDAAFQLNYTGTLSLEAREPAQIGDQRHDDCLRVRNSLSIGARDTGFTRSWYCAGAGVVRSELYSPDGTLVSSSLLADSSALPAANNNEMPKIGTSLTHAIDWRRPLTVTWQFDNTDGVSAITTPPVVAGDVVLVGTFTGDVIALDQSTGQERWRYYTGGPIFAAPVVANGVAYMGSVDRHVHAIDIETGAFRWRFPTRDAVIASPVVSGNVVYAGSEDHTLYALDAQTGRLLASFATSGPIAVAPAVMGDTVYAGSDDGALYALDALDLSLRWAFAAGSAIASAPLVAGDVVYVGAHNSVLYALKAHPRNTAGEAVWQVRFSHPIAGHMHMKGSTLFAAGDYDLYAIDAGSGRVQWRQAAAAYYIGSPLLLNDSVFEMTNAGLAQFDAASGEILAEMALANGARSAGFSTDGIVLYAGFANGDVFALAPR